MLAVSTDEQYAGVSGQLFRDFSSGDLLSLYVQYIHAHNEKLWLFWLLVFVWSSTEIFHLHDFTLPNFPFP